MNEAYQPLESVMENVFNYWVLNQENKNEEVTYVNGDLYEALQDAPEDVVVFMSHGVTGLEPALVAQYKGDTVQLTRKEAFDRYLQNNQPDSIKMNGSVESGFALKLRDLFDPEALLESTKDLIHRMAK